MNAALALALLLVAPDAAPVPTIPPASIDDTLDVTGDAIAARRIAMRMAVSVAVNGQGPYRFIVDSGADRTVIGEDLARRLSLPPAGQVNVQGMAGARIVSTVRIDALTVGASIIPDIVAPALPEHHIGADGLLGIDALAEQRLKLDFEKRTITVQDSRVPQSPRADEIVVTARRRKGQLILTQVRAGNGALYAVIDTGSQVTIGNMALLRRIARGKSDLDSTPVTIVSVTGQTIVAALVTVPEIRIGGIVLKGVAVAFADVPPFALFGLAQQPALLLGTDTLEAFRSVSLDFRHRRIRFAVRR